MSLSFALQSKSNTTLSVVHLTEGHTYCYLVVLLEDRLVLKAARIKSSPAGRENAELHEPEARRFAETEARQAYLID